MKGITPVIAVILLLLITISLVGFAFVFLGRTTETAAESGEQQLEQQISQIAARFVIENVGAGKVYIRNLGTETIPTNALAVYVNDKKVDYILASGVGSNEVGEVVITPKSCKDFLDGGLRISAGAVSDSASLKNQRDGMYKIKPATDIIDVYCDMTTDGGGWTRCMSMIAGDTSTCDTDKRWQNCIKIGETGSEIMSKWFNVGSVSPGATPVSVVKFRPGPYNTIKNMFSFPGTDDGWDYGGSSVFSLQVISGTSYGNAVWWDWGGTLQRKANYCIGTTPDHQACVYEGTAHVECGKIYHDGIGWSSSGTAQELYVK